VLEVRQQPTSLRLICNLYVAHSLKNVRLMTSGTLRHYEASLSLLLTRHLRLFRGGFHSFGNFLHDSPLNIYRPHFFPN
jgi:hypothetical protein